MNIRKNSELSILIDSRIYAYLFSPIVQKLVYMNVKIYIYARLDIIDQIKGDIVENPLINYLTLDPILKKNRGRFFLHRALMNIFTNRDFLYLSTEKYKLASKKYSPLTKFIFILSRFIPKVPNGKINEFLSKITSAGMKNPFRTRVILVASLNSCAELLGLKSQAVITVMESWDHAVKKPSGYSSRMVFVWNSALRDDWKAKQNDKEVHVFYPLKLRYARDVVPFQDLSSYKKHKDKFFVYSVAATRRFSFPSLVNLEKRLIEDLAKAAQAAGWDFFIKPRPNGEPGEFDEILKKYSNVKIGSVLNQKAGHPANYFLDDEYNFLRFSEIAGAEFVINAFTTFGLDAASANVPVLQIDIRKADSYEDSKFVYENDHIKKHLLQKEFVLKLSGNLVNSFKEYLLKPNDYPAQYSKALKKWLYTDLSQNQAIDKLINKVIDC